MATLDLEAEVEEVSLEWAPIVAVVKYVMSAWYVTTNTKVALVLDAALKCNALTFDFVKKNVFRRTKKESDISQLY